MVFNDCITSQNKLEAKLPWEKDLQFAKFLMERSIDAVIWVNLEGHLLHANHVACQLLGYSYQELLSMSLQELEPDLTTELWLERLQALIQESYLIVESYHWTTFNGLLPVEMNLCYLEYENQGYICILIRNLAKSNKLEITNNIVPAKVNDLRKIEQKLYSESSVYKQIEAYIRQNQTIFCALVETTNAILAIIQGQKLYYINSAVEIITGYKPEEFINQPNLLERFNLQGLGEVDTQHYLVFPKHEEVKIITKSGEERWLDCSMQVFEFGEKSATLLTAIDITKRAEVKMRQALEKEKELSEVRARLVSMISHEFRTPLNLISFSSGLLKRHFHQWYNDKKIPYIERNLERIQTAVEQISQLMDKVLILGKTEAGKVGFEPKMLNLEQLCRDLVAELQFSNNNQHTLTFVAQGDYSAICVDEKLLQPIVVNLITNAIKYSPKGSTVNLALFYQNQKLVLQVSDQGIGIPIADQKRLFEAFYRASNVGDIPGNGLGLAVVKKLVDLHGGQISFESEIGIGTIFRIQLPLNHNLEKRIFNCIA